MVMDDQDKRIFDKRERELRDAYEKQAQEFAAGVRARLSVSRAPAVDNSLRRWAEMEKEAGGIPVETERKRNCKVCKHPERSTIERALGIGQGPRSILRRYARGQLGLTRVALQRHRDLCLTEDSPISPPAELGEEG